MKMVFFILRGKIPVVTKRFDNIDFRHHSSGFLLQFAFSLL